MLRIHAFAPDITCRQRRPAATAMEPHNIMSSSDMSDGCSNSLKSDAQTFYNLHDSTRQIIRPSCGGADANDNSHQVLLFSNDRIKVSDFRLRPCQSVSVSHEYSTIRWQVSYSGISQHRVKISKTNQESEEHTLSGCVEDRALYFVEAGSKWEIKNESQDVEYRQIIFEFMFNKPKYTQEEISDMFAKARYSTNVGTQLVFENELCRCWDFYLEPSEGGGHETVHHHCLDYVFINVAPSRLLGLHPETLSLEDLLFDSISEDNQVTWNSIPKEAATDIAYAHGGKNGYDDRPMREYLVELK